jgi:hypothetical protein
MDKDSMPLGCVDLRPAAQQLAFLHQASGQQYDTTEQVIRLYGNLRGWTHAKDLFRDLAAAEAKVIEIHQ